MQGMLRVAPEGTDKVV